MSLPDPQVLFEDPHLLALDKPGGILVIPGRKANGTPALLGLAEQRFGRLLVLHRLDRDTSGVVVFARTAQAHREMSRLFELRQVEKKYWALVVGVVQPDEGVVALPLHTARKGKMRPARDGEKGSLAACTRFRVLERFSGFSWLEVLPETGRLHQIRVHLKSLGHPVAQDPKYAPRVARQGPAGLSRTALHAAALRFPHPVPPHPLVQIESPLPAELQDVLRGLRQAGSNG